MLMAAQRLPRTWTEAYSRCCPSASTNNGGGRYDYQRAAAAEFRDCPSISFEVRNCSVCGFGVPDYAKLSCRSREPRDPLVLPDSKKASHTHISAWIWRFHQVRMNRGKI